MVGEAELLLRLDLGRQAVAVPAEPALDPAAAHGLVAGHHVLDVAGQQVAVVRQAVGERRAVVEDVLVGAVHPASRASTEATKVLSPAQWSSTRRSTSGRLGAGRHAGAVGVILRVRHRWSLSSRWSRSCRATRRTNGRRRDPRYHLAWPAGAAGPARWSAVTGRIPSGSTEVRWPATCSSGGSPVIAGSMPLLPGYRDRHDRPQTHRPQGSRGRSAQVGEPEGDLALGAVGESEACTRFSRLDRDRSPRMVPAAAFRPSVAPTRPGPRRSPGRRRGPAATSGPLVMNPSAAGRTPSPRARRSAGRPARRPSSAAPWPRSAQPLRSNRTSTSPTRPRRTASGLISTSVRSVTLVHPSSLARSLVTAGARLPGARAGAAGAAGRRRRAAGTPGRAGVHGRGLLAVEPAQAQPVPSTRASTSRRPGQRWPSRPSPRRGSPARPAEYATAIRRTPAASTPRAVPAGDLVAACGRAGPSARCSSAPAAGRPARWPPPAPRAARPGRAPGPASRGGRASGRPAARPRPRRVRTADSAARALERHRLGRGRSAPPPRPAGSRLPPARHATCTVDTGAGPGPAWISAARSANGTVRTSRRRSSHSAADLGRGEPAVRVGSDPDRHGRRHRRPDAAQPRRQRAQPGQMRRTGGLAVDRRRHHVGGGHAAGAGGTGAGRPPPRTTSGRRCGRTCRAATAPAAAATPISTQAGPARRRPRRRDQRDLAPRPAGRPAAGTRRSSTSMGGHAPQRIEAGDSLRA